jgi:small subunit ribosomal protein S16
MAVVIRLSKIGVKGESKYRITVADSRKFVKGKFLEVIGYYNSKPGGTEKPLVLDMEKYNSWVKKGAQPTDRVRSVVRKLQTNV